MPPTKGWKILSKEQITIVIELVDFREVNYFCHINCKTKKRTISRLQFESNKEEAFMIFTHMRNPKLMKNALLILLCLVTFAACKKEVTRQPEPPVTQKPTERDFSLAYVNSPSQQIEIIVTDTAARFLLDTLLSVNDMHSLKVYSDQTKFNITTIEHIDSINKINVQTFYQVLPDHWNINQPNNVGFYDRDRHTGEVDGSIYYYNVPASVQGQDFQLGNAFSGGSNSDNGMYENYRSKLPFHSCLLFPLQKLYRLYDAASTVDSVDLGKMDTALTYTYQKSSPLKISWTDVTIFEKKNDPSTRVRFWQSFPPALSPYYDILYPSRSAQQYLVNFTALDANGRASYTTQFSDSLQPGVDFLDATYFNIKVQDSLHFDISFPKTQPSYYTVSIGGDNLIWKINLPATKKTFNGADKIIDLSKSIGLHGINYSKMKLTELLLGNGDNMNYTDYYNFIFATAAAGGNTMRQWQMFWVEL